MTLAERILAELARAARPLDDDQLGERLGVARQAVNQVARQLEKQGRLVRYANHGEKIKNRLPAGQPAVGPLTEPVAPVVRPGDLLSEDEVKAAVRDHLEAAGYKVSVAWGRRTGVDIDAAGPDGRLLIEAKGAVALQPQQHNYFLGAIGELVQRMSDPQARYGLALPDNPQYRGLVQRLPDLVWERLRLVVFFVVRGDGGGYRVAREER